MRMCLTMVFIIIVVLAFAGWVMTRATSSFSGDRADRALQEYSSALDGFKKNPNDAELENMARLKGHAYVVRSRSTPGFVPYTVLQLNRAIDDAKSAVRTSNEVQTSDSNAPSTDIEARLQRLERLRSVGTITDDEYADQRRAIVSEL